MFTGVKIYDGTYDQEDFNKEMLASKDQDGLMSKEDKAKLDELASGGEETITVEAANVIQDETHMFASEAQLAKVDAIPEDAVYTDTVYEHPETHDATMIVEDETHRFVTDEEKASWIKRSEMAVANGVATLDESGIIPSAQLPGFVDDIIEEDDVSKFPETGESGKLYVDTSTNKTYRWSGTAYIVIPETIALGETSSTAYAGDKGKANADAIAAIVDGTTVVPKAGDANTVGGFTVEVSIPADAVFTDTVYVHPETHDAAMIVESAVKKFATEAQLAKVDAIPSDAVFTDTVYTHPDTHPATMIVEDEDHKFVTAEEKAKVDAIPEDAVYTDTVYEHPATHDASMIVEDETHKFATEAQLAKVDAIPEDAVFTDTVYEHPETHPATMIVEDEDHRFVMDIEKTTWNAKADAVEVTAEADGLMIAEDKVKLDAIPEFVNTPYYDETEKAVFGCGVAITIDTTETDGVLKCTYVREGTKSFTFPANGDVNIYGGGNGKDDPCFYPATCVTINGGALFAVCGGNLKAGNIGSATVIINGGSFASGIIAGSLTSADKRECDGIVGHAEIIVNNTDGNALTVFGGPQGLGIMGDVRLTINGGDLQWVTAGGSNGYTGYGEVIVNGGNMTVLQGCNRGSMGNIKMTINGGTIQRVYAGGETEDSQVTATYKKAEVIVNGGTIGTITAGTNGGVEDATNVSGTYVEGVITDEAASAMNLTKAAVKFTDIALNGTILEFKIGDTVIKSVDLASLNA